MNSPTYIKNNDENRPLSRYNRIRYLLSSDSIPVQESWDSPDIPELNTDVFVKVKPEWEHRPDLISLAFYGTLRLYWVIAWANKMTDPIAETIIDKELRIPDPEFLFQSVLIK